MRYAKVGGNAFTLHCFWREDTGYFGEARSDNGTVVASTPLRLKSERAVFAWLNRSINSDYGKRGNDASDNERTEY